jgi:hypothetical protein
MIMASLIWGSRLRDASQTEDRYVFKEIIGVDLEEPRFALKGMRKIQEMDVGARGEILLTDGWRAFLVDSQGTSLHLIGRNGQGPGEYEMVSSLRIMNDGMIFLFDPVGSKCIFYNQDGVYVRERRIIEVPTFSVLALDNGFFLVLRRVENRDDTTTVFYSIYNDRLNHVCDLKPRYSFDKPTKKFKYNGMGYAIGYILRPGQIDIASNAEDDFHLYRYTETGLRERVIEFEVKRAKTSPAYRQDQENRLKKVFGQSNWLTGVMKNLYFPKYFPVFKWFGRLDTDDLVIELYEERPQEHDSVLQIVDSAGRPQGSLSLPAAQFRRLIKNRIYSAYEKDSGYLCLRGYLIARRVP